MITTKNVFSGANFDYASENNCIASGEYRHEDGKLISVSINGQLTKNETAYPFWANLDASGNINISGVPAAVLSDVEAEVAEIVSEIEGKNKSKK